MGAAGRTEPEAVSLISVGINVRRGHDGALSSVLLAAGCSEGYVFEQRNQAYCLSTWMGSLRLLVALSGRGGLESDPVQNQQGCTQKFWVCVVGFPLSWKLLGDGPALEGNTNS